MTKAWEQVVNAAMLGTDKPVPLRLNLPGEMAKLMTCVDETEDLAQEDRFLQKAALINTYRQSGFVPPANPELALTKAEAETQPYCSAQAMALLNSIIEEDNDGLLTAWLRACIAKAQIIQPDILPALLDKAVKDEDLQALAIACSGKRGEWLSQMNTVWNYFQASPDEELWLNGKPEERLKVLKKIRGTAPAKATEWLQQTWEQENAASKVELLKVMRDQISDADIAWLESLFSEKSQKVKDEVADLLKRISGSTIVRKYEALLSRSVALKKEKGLLGLVNKTSLQLSLPADIDEEIFKSGIDKLAPPNSPFSDEQYIIYQLISQVPPTLWEQHFGVTAEEAFTYFNKYAPNMVSGLGLATGKFKTSTWFSLFLAIPGFYPDVVMQLPAAQQQAVLTGYFTGDPQNILHYALRATEEWSPEFSLMVVGFMASNPYQYNRTVIKQYIALIHPGILPKIADIQGPWEKSGQYLAQLLTLKQQIQQVF